MDHTALRRGLRVAGAIATLGALWFAAAAPFYQGAIVRIFGH
jgi:hypothetical protein